MKSDTIDIIADPRLIDLFQRARGSGELAVIEGVQALKHAVRFEAEVQRYITCDITMLQNLLEELANDVKDVILSNVQEVNEETFAKLSPQPPRTKVIAIAKRKPYKLSEIDKTKPIVFLEDPRDLENIGAVIRVSAAADVGAVITSGPTNIWHPAVIRGGAGLQYTLPVFDSSCHPEFSSGSSIKTTEILKQVQSDRKVICLDPTGDDITDIEVPNNAILVFGTERHGISKQLIDQSDDVAKLPMKPGVSSLNLATSVAATLYQLQ
jgi:tRNA G18 (ribose-2'-O)-methylase SpoU